MHLSKQSLRIRLGFVFLVLIYKLILSVFIFQMHEQYAYYGMVFQPRSFVSQAVSAFFIALCALFTDVKATRASNGLHCILFLLCLVPISAEFDMNASQSPYLYWPLVFVFLATPIITQLIPTNQSLSARRFSFDQFELNVYVLLGLFIVLLVSTYSFNLSFSSLDALYDQRDVYKENTNRIAEYAFNWLLYALNPALILYSLWRKKVWLTILSLVISVYMFGLGGHKAALVIAPAAALLLLLHKVARKSLFLWLTGSFVLLLSGIAFYNFVTDEVSVVSSLVVRRGLLLPAQIFFNYGEYFSEHSLNFFSHNFPFSLFISSPYEMKIPSIIGDEFYSAIGEVHANGNVFADTFANIGYWSFPLLTLILPLFYYFVDNVSTGKVKLVAIPLVAISSITLANSGMIVSLITHGIVIILLLVKLLPESRFELKRLMK